MNKSKVPRFLLAHPDHILVVLNVQDNCQPIA